MPLTPDNARQALEGYVADGLGELADKLPGMSARASSMLAAMLADKLVSAIQDGIFSDGYRLGVRAGRVLFIGFDKLPEL